MKLQKNISLQHLNTFGIDVSCKLFCTVSSTKEIERLLSCEEFIENNVLILGGGSNLLFTKDFNGLIVKNEVRGFETLSESKDNKIIKVGAGENWHQFVLWSIENGLSGIENMALIPGNVGASPMQNIGAYGAEAKDVIDKVWAIEIENGKELILSNKDCQFQYRNSIFKNALKDKLIITHVSFKLSKTPKNNTEYGAIMQEIKDLDIDVSTKSICNAVINIRKRKLPNPDEIGNSGSFFKNPIISTSKFKDLQNKNPEIVGYKISETKTKVAAGWLIEKCGWKGYRKGDAGVHKNQALVLVNYGKATGEDIISLATKIQESVKEKFDIDIHPEVNIIG